MLWQLQYRAIFSLLRLVFGVRRAPRMERVGTDYGGWFVPVGLLGADWVVYSAGTGEDISFDVGMVKRFGCAVHAFDPTPRARDFVRRQTHLPPGFHFHPYGLWDKDVTVRFYAPRDPHHVSHSIHNLQGTTNYFEGEVKRLDSVMDALGHRRLDLLKLDIEGAEYDVIDDMVESDIRPRVLCVEFERHGLRENYRAVKSLAECGYRLVHVEKRNLTFVCRRSPETA